MQKGFTVIEMTVAAVLACLIVAMVIVDHAEYEQWLTFRDVHHCRIVAHVDGSTFTTIGTDAKGNVSTGVGSTSAKDGWLCDDGVTYYKDAQ